MKTEIVIARYNENLDWLELLDPNIKITIYNKGKDDIKYPFITLPNVGRESHTYLYHLVTNYYNMSDLTIFCQGDSIFHSPDFIKLINNHRDKFEPIQPLSAYYWPENVLPNRAVPPVKMLSFNDHWIDDCMLTVAYMNNDMLIQYPYSYYENHMKGYSNYMLQIYNITNSMEFLIKRYLLNVDLSKPKELYPMCWAGLFAVKKHVVLAHPIDYYNNMLNMILYDLHPDYYGKFSSNKYFDLGIAFERLWLVIFDYKYHSKKYKKFLQSDFELETKYPKIINNQVNFQIHNEICNLFIEINTDDNKIIQIMISDIVATAKIKSKSKSKIKNEIQQMNPTKNVKVILKNHLIVEINSINLIQLPLSNTKKLLKFTLYDVSKQWSYIDFNQK
jgi:hypothetical protein